MGVKLKKKYVHLPSGGIYTVIKTTEIKLPHIGWFPGVVYRSKEGKIYTRFLEDFENKFIPYKKNKNA